jgi:hypothetical protein
MKKMLRPFFHKSPKSQKVEDASMFIDNSKRTVVIIHEPIDLFNYKFFYSIFLIGIISICVVVEQMR